VDYCWRAANNNLFFPEMLPFVLILGTEAFKYLLIIVLRFDAILYSELGNENCNTDHNQMFMRPQVPHPWIKPLYSCFRSEFYSFTHPLDSLLYQQMRQACICLCMLHGNVNCLYFMSFTQFRQSVIFQCFLPSKAVAS